MADDYVMHLTVEIPGVDKFFGPVKYFPKEQMILGPVAWLGETGYGVWHKITPSMIENGYLDYLEWIDPDEFAIFDPAEYPGESFESVIGYDI